MHLQSVWDGILKVYHLSEIDFLLYSYIKKSYLKIILYKWVAKISLHITIAYIVPTSVSGAKS